MVYINSFDFNNEYNQINADVSLPPYELTSEVYIDTVIIGSQNAYDVETGEFKFDDEGITESYNEYFTKTTYKYGWMFKAKHEYGTEDEYPTSKTFSVNGLPINTDDLSINDLYFIQIKTQGAYSADTPCSSTGDTWGSLYDKFSIDAKGMQYMKELADDCNTPTDLIDYILNKNAVDVAAGCGDYATMISRYNELMGYSNVTTIGNVTNNYKKCGCNG